MSYGWNLKMLYDFLIVTRFLPSCFHVIGCKRSRDLNTALWLADKSLLLLLSCWLLQMVSAARQMSAKIAGKTFLWHIAFRLAACNHIPPAFIVRDKYWLIVNLREESDQTYTSTKTRSGQTTFISNFRYISFCAQGQRNGLCLEPIKTQREHNSK